MLANSEIKLTPSFIIGLPGETEATLQRTLRLAQKIKYFSNFEEVFAACFTPYPGSVSFQWLKKRCPELGDQDLFDGEKLIQLWFKHFCKVPYETARRYVGEILSLGRYKITTDKGGYPTSV